MKNIFTFLIFILSFVLNNLTAQTSPAKTDSLGKTNKPKKNNNQPNVDPRKYISVYDLRKDNKDAKLINTFPSSQLINYVDEKSCLLIDFDLESLSKDTLFYGTLSLTAKINEREVQIDGYTKIGEKEKSAGLSNAFSSYDFATSLIGMLQKADEYNGSISDSVKFKYNKYITSTKKEQLNLIKIETTHEPEEITFLRDKANEFAGQTDVFHYSDLKLDFIKNFINSSDNVNLSSYPDRFFTYLPRLKSNEGKRINIGRTIAKMVSDYDSTKKANDDDASKYIKDGYFNYFKFSNYIENYQLNAAIFNEYIEYFLSTNPYALNALSLSVNRDPVFMHHIVNGLHGESNKINALLPKIEDLKNLIDNHSTAADAYEEMAKQLASEMNSNLEEFDRLIGDLKSINYVYLKDLYDKYNASNNSAVVYKNMFADNNFRQKAIKEIAQKAAKNAFNLLNTGSLDLDQLDAKEGDIIRLYVSWTTSRIISKSDGTSDTLSKTVILPITSVRVKNLGWNAKPVDSFFLINRISPDNNDPNISPSRFKGAPGGSILLTFSSDKRRFMTYRYLYDDTASSRMVPYKKHPHRTRRFLGLLEPSIGINVSYVDFDIKKDFEVGAGIVVGLFRNSIMFTGGVDLNTVTHPWYMGVGFSFGQITQNIKTGFKYNN